MRWYLAMLAAVAALVAPVAEVSGARDPSTASATSARIEVVVFEVDACYSCEAFRAIVLPHYTGTEHARGAPIRFVNVAHTDPKKLALASPLSIVPTAVVMKDGREVDRIAGLFGPVEFVRMLSHILDRAE